MTKINRFFAYGLGGGAIATTGDTGGSGGSGGSGSGTTANTILLLDGTDFTDKSSFNHLVTNNGVTIVDGAYTFSRTEQDYLSIPDNEAFNFGSNDFLIEAVAKVKKIEVAVAKTIISQISDPLASNTGSFFFLSNNALKFYYSNDSGKYISTLSGTVPSGIDYANTFNTFKVERVANDLILYVNDVVVDTKNISTSIANSSAEIRIGATQLTGDRFFDGAIQSVKIEKY